MKNAGSIIGTVVAPFALQYYNNQTYNIRVISTTGATYATGSGWSTSNTANDGQNASALSCSGGYGFPGAFPTYDELITTISYYTIEQ